MALGRHISERPNVPIGRDLGFGTPLPPRTGSGISFPIAAARFRAMVKAAIGPAFEVAPGGGVIFGDASGHDVARIVSVSRRSKLNFFLTRSVHFFRR
jgi:hypothetical protein